MNKRNGCGEWVNKKTDEGRIMRGEMVNGQMGGVDGMGHGKALGEMAGGKGGREGTVSERF